MKKNETLNGTVYFYFKKEKDTKQACVQLNEIGLNVKQKWEKILKINISGKNMEKLKTKLEKLCLEAMNYSGFVNAEFDIKEKWFLN